MRIKKMQSDDDICLSNSGAAVDISEIEKAYYNKDAQLLASLKTVLNASSAKGSAFSFPLTFRKKLKEAAKGYTVAEILVASFIASCDFSFLLNEEIISNDEDEGSAFCFFAYTLAHTFIENIANSTPKKILTDLKKACAYMLVTSQRAFLNFTASKSASEDEKINKVLDAIDRIFASNITALPSVMLKEGIPATLTKICALERLYAALTFNDATQKKHTAMLKNVNTEVQELHDKALRELRASVRQYVVDGDFLTVAIVEDILNNLNP